MADLQGLLALLECHGKIKKLKSSRGLETWEACCPSHNDKHPSLRVTLTADDRILLKCWAGCGAVDILMALGFDHEKGIDWSILMPEKKNYHSVESVFGPRPKKKQ